MNLIYILKNSSLGVVLLILPISIIAKNLTGALYGVAAHEFSFNYFKRGLFKGIGLYGVFGLLSCIAWLSSEFTFNGLGLVEALIILLTVVIGIHIKDTFELLYKLFNIKTTEEL